MTAPDGPRRTHSKPYLRPPRVRSMARILLAFALVVPLLAGCADDTTDDATVEPPGDPVPAAWEPAWGDPASAAVRPGASLGGYCTFNFLYTGHGPDGEAAAFIGTAGHCTEAIGERVEVPGSGEVGTVVYDSDVAPGADAAVDFALVRLDPAAVGSAHPSMLGHDGPSGAIDAADLAVGDPVGIHGYGVVFGDQEATRDRSGVLVDWDERLYRIDMPAVNGDSGSPILHLATGKALGIVSHYGLAAVPPSTDEGPLVPFILEELAKAGFDVQVANA